MGWALDELGVDIEDSDAIEKSYYVNLVRTKEGGFFSKLIGMSAENISIQLIVKQREEGSQVIFYDLSEADEQKTIDYSFIFFKEISNQF